MASSIGHGNYGAFCFKRHQQVLSVIVSASDGWEQAGFDGVPFEHVSVSLKHRCPTWDEMHYCKMLFWEHEECVIQYHPPQSQYVNVHPYCLHLFKPVDFDFPIPPKGVIG